MFMEFPEAVSVHLVKYSDDFEALHRFLIEHGIVNELDEWCSL